MALPRLRFKREEKRAIYEKSRSTPGITLAQLGEWAQRELGLVRPIGVSTVAYLLKHQKEELEQQANQQAAADRDGDGSDSDGDDGSVCDEEGDVTTTTRRHTPGRPLNRPLLPLSGSRIHMTLQQKKQMFEKFQATPDMKFRELGEWAAEQFGLGKPPSKSTLSHIIKRQRLEPVDTAVRNPDMKRKTAFRSASMRVESDLIKWIQGIAEFGVSLENSQIRAYASRLRDELVEKETDPQACEKLKALQFSRDWLSKFQHEHGLTEPRTRRQTD